VSALAVLPDRAVLAGDLARGGYLHGSFPFAGGAASRWFETELVLTRPGVLARCAGLLAAAVDPRADRLAAGGPGPLLLAAALGLATDVALLVGDEREGPAFHGDAFPGARVVLVEDVLMTGARALAAVAALRAAGLEVCGALAVLDREQGARVALEAAGVPLTTLFRERDLLA
jgi:orotate phosphoribosyltransferase